MELQLIQSDAEICIHERLRQKREICFFRASINRIRGNKGVKLPTRVEKIHVLTASQNEQWNVH